MHFSFVLGCCAWRWLFLSRQTEMWLLLEQIWWNQAGGQFSQDPWGFHKKALLASYSVRHLIFLSVRTSAGHWISWRTSRILNYKGVRNQWVQEKKCYTHPPYASPTLQPIKEGFGSPLKRGTTEKKHHGQLFLKGIILDCVLIYCLRPKCFCFHISNSVILGFGKITHFCWCLSFITS